LVLLLPFLNDGNLILSIEPAAQVDQLASLAAEGIGTGHVGIGGGDGTLADGTVHGCEVRGVRVQGSGKRE